MKSKALLRFLLILGGIVELAIGVFFMFLDILFRQVGLENIAIFTQMAGSFLFCYGILLIYSVRDIEKFIIIPLINIPYYPEFLIIIIFTIPYDSVWSVLMLLFLWKNGILFKKS
jgi:hypothetical protein